MVVAARQDASAASNEEVIMKVQGLDGRTYHWSLKGHVPLGSEEAGSEYHARARMLLAQLFPADRRLEEVGLPGSGDLRADFYLPARRLVVEVHGRQHYEFVAFFHKTFFGFLQHQRRDLEKQAWCVLNALTYCELPYDESDPEWSRRILASLRQKPDHRGTSDGPGK
jgi:hypothetical protein